MKVGFEVERASLFSVETGHFIREHGKMIICGDTVDSSPKTPTTKEK